MSALPQFLTRFFRPFTSTVRMSAPATPVTVPEGAERATVAAGCFWGVEHLYRKHFADKGLYDARVGYIGGDAADPSYQAVCSGNTGRTCTHTASPNPPRTPSRTHHKPLRID
jgi:peptide-methionine (S)-S-oxide reductase